jgi:hypothetical protein
MTFVLVCIYFIVNKTEHLSICYIAVCFSYAWEHLLTRCSASILDLVSNQYKIFHTSAAVEGVLAQDLGEEIEGNSE